MHGWKGSHHNVTLNDLVVLHDTFSVKYVSWSSHQKRKSESTRLERYLEGEKPVEIYRNSGISKRGVQQMAVPV